MARHSEDIYGDEGSVPQQTRVDGSGAGPMSVHASPQDFGAQIGEGIQKIGNTAEDISIKYANMAMETAQNTAEVGFIKDAGDLKAKYMQYEGSSAEVMRPQYEAEMQGLQTKWGANLPLIAQHQYNQTTLRSLRFATSDYAGYAAGQTKQANMESGAAQIDIGKWKASDPSVAMDDRRFGEQSLAPITYGHQVQLDADAPGFKTDPKSGEISFDESNPIGKNAKAEFENNLNHSVGLAWENRFSTLSKTLGPVAAYDKFQKDKDEIPPDSVVRLESSLQPQVFNAHAKSVTNAVMGEASQAHREILLNSSNAGSNANNLGNVKTAEGAKNNTQDFISPATPIDGAILAANNLRTKNYEGKTLEQIGHIWTSTDPDNWVKNVSAASGIDSKTVPDLNDPATLGKLLKGISVAEKPAKDRELFTDDVISQGVQASLSGKPPQTSSAKPYATNAQGAPLSLADYASTHREYLLARGDEYAESTMPGSLQFRNTIRQRVNQQISTAIEDQHATNNQYNNQILRGFNGEFTKGEKPKTWDELEAIPGMRDIINYSNIHTAEFIKSLDGRLTARAAGAKEDKSLGQGYLDGLKGIHPTDGSEPTITNANQVYDMYYAGKITDSGRTKLIGELTNASKDPAGSATVAAKTGAWEQLHKQFSYQNLTNKQSLVYDPKGEASWASAVPLLEKQLDANREQKIPDYKSFDPQDKDYVGNVVKPLLRSPAQLMSDRRKDSLMASGMNEGDNPVTVRPIIKSLASGELSGDAARASILKLVNNGMSKQTARSLLLKYNLAAETKKPIEVPKAE